MPNYLGALRTIWLELNILCPGKPLSSMQTGRVGHLISQVRPGIVYSMIGLSDAIHTLGANSYLNSSMPFSPTYDRAYLIFIFKTLFKFITDKKGD